MTKVYSRMLPLPKWKTSDLRWPKFGHLRIPPPNEKFFRFEMTKVYSRMLHPKWKTSDLRWPKFTSDAPPMKLWSSQMTRSLLQNCPPNEKLHIEMTKVYFRMPPSHKWKTSDLRWPKFGHSRIPPNEKVLDFRWPNALLGMLPLPKWKTSDFRWPKFTQIGSFPICPPNEKLQIWDDQSLLGGNAPTQWKTSDLRWPKFTPEYPPNEKLQISDDQSLLRNASPPKMKNFRFEITKVYSGMPLPKWKTLDLRWQKSLLQNAPNEKLQISDDQSLLQNAPPQWKTSDLRWPKFTLEYPPNEKLQISDDQSLLWNAPPPMKNFRFEMTKVYFRMPPKWKTSDLRWPKFTLECPPKMKNFRFEMTKVYF